MSQDQYKRGAAAAAMAEVEDGMRIGLGTGSTARHFVDFLGARVREGLRVVCVPTSEATARQALALDIPLTDLETIDALDLTVDGADEIGPGLQLIKGGGGALLREKIVAAASARMVVIADDSKVVDTLGQFPLPIEVNRFGLRATERAIAEVMAFFGADGGLSLRVGPEGAPFRSDGGNLILDAFFGRISDSQALSSALLEIPGVVQHGLFLGLCDKAYVAGPGGVVAYDG